MKKIDMVVVSIIWLLVSGAAFAVQDVSAPDKAMPDAVLAASAAQASSSRAEFPVSFAGSEILKVASSPIASLTPEARATLIVQNIEQFATGKTSEKQLKVMPRPEGYAIGNDAIVLMLITAADVAQSGTSTLYFANQTLKLVQAAIADYRDRNNWRTYGLGAALTIFSIIALWLALRWNNRAHIWLTRRVSGLHDHWKGGIHFKGIEVLSSVRIERIILVSLKVLRVFLMLLCLYFFLPLILSFFPETRALGSKILDYMISPFTSIFFTIVKYIPNLFFIFVIGVIAKYVLKLISYVFMLIERGELKFEWFHDDWARPTYQIVRFLVIVTALISAYPYIPGSSSQAFQGVGLVLGAIISFASSSAISNIVAGVILTYTRAFRLNDRITVGETTGDVVEKTLLVTRVKTIKHVVVTIPNSLVMGAQIINYSTSAAEGDGVILHTAVTIGYDVPWKQVHSLLIAAAQDTGKLLKEPAPFVLQTSLDDWYVGYEINAYTKEPERMAVIYSDLHKNIQDKFDAAGVEIMSPHYYAMRDGNPTTVPSVLTDKKYVQPAFRVNTGAAAD
ncbi:MAG: mechanosensitive ion channel domain-containing protein [Gallionella sp.]